MNVFEAAQQRIERALTEFDYCYVSFSGGKDSTVLAHLVHDIYPDVPLVFSNTGLEYPEIQAFARKMGAEFIRPKMAFSDVISKCGYPIISKEVSEAIYFARSINKENNKRRGDGFRSKLMGKMYADGTTDAKNKDTKKSMFNKTKWLPLCNETQFTIGSYCCRNMKENPLAKYEQQTKRRPYIATMAEESTRRTQSWINYGCNAFNATKPKSQPMSFWTEQDVLQFIVENKIEIASVYGEILAINQDGYMYNPMPGVECKLKCTGCKRTGCIFCGFGAHLEKESRFARLAKTHPKQYEYCLSGGQWVDNPKYDPAAQKMDGEWVNWNPKKIWVPSKKGLGMKKVFDDCNQIYGKDFIKYE